MPDYAKIDDLLENIRGYHFGTEADVELETHLSRLLRRDGEGNSIPEPVRFGRTKETRGILFVEAAGAGKTTTVSRLLEKHPGLRQTHIDHMPFVDVTVPPEPTLKSMAFRLLSRAGFEIERTRRTTFQLFDQLRAIMARNGQIIIWIDEAHDLMVRDQAQILRATKSLMQGDGSVIVIMSGTEELEDIIRSDPQVQRRFTIVKPRQLDQTNDSDRILGIMDTFCEVAGLGQLSDTTIVPRLLIASRNQLGRAIEMMENAIEQALIAEDPSLELWHFGLAWGMQESRDAANNPFTVDDWERIDPDAKPAEEARRKKGRGRPKK